MSSRPESRLAPAIASILLLAVLPCCFAADDEAASAGSETLDRVEFEAHYRAWQVFRLQPAVMFSSRTADHLDSDSFRAIVAGGEDFLPFIVEKLQGGDHFLNGAMAQITGVDIYALYPQAEIVGAQDVSQLWLRWWYQQHPGRPQGGQE